MFLPSRALLNPAPLFFKITCYILDRHLADTSYSNKGQILSALDINKATNINSFIWNPLYRKNITFPKTSFPLISGKWANNSPTALIAKWVRVSLLYLGRFCIILLTLSVLTGTLLMMTPSEGSVQVASISFLLADRSFPLTKKERAKYMAMTLKKTISSSL